MKSYTISWNFSKYSLEMKSDTIRAENLQNIRKRLLLEFKNRKYAQIWVWNNNAEKEKLYGKLIIDNGFYSWWPHNQRKGHSIEYVVNTDGSLAGGIDHYLDSKTKKVLVRRV